MLRATWVVAICFLAICVGCARVQRTLSINSDPEGAVLVMNDQEVGRIPVTRDFVWYGWYDVTLRKEGYKTLKTKAEVIAPAWQWPPFDLIADFSPARLKDKHKLLFKLEPEEAPPSNDEMLGRAEQMRVQLESSPNTKLPRRARSPNRPRPNGQPVRRPPKRPSRQQHSRPPSQQRRPQPRQSLLRRRNRRRGRASCRARLIQP